MILEISIGIAAFAYRETLEDSFKNGLQNSMRTYKTVKENKEAVDLMQRTVSSTRNVSCKKMLWKIIFFFYEII